MKSWHSANERVNNQHLRPKMTEKQSFIFTNYEITLPNIYCTILFITVVAFNKNNVRDIHIFHPLPPTKKKTTNKTFSCLICMNYLSHFFITMVLFSPEKKSEGTEKKALCIHISRSSWCCIIWNIVLRHRSHIPRYIPFRIFLWFLFNRSKHGLFPKIQRAFLLCCLQLYSWRSM